MAEPGRSTGATGPRTTRGKGRSSRNAVTHGLLAKVPLLPDEDPAEFERFQSAIIAELDPKGALEQLLAGRVVLAAWRLLRLARAETGIMAHESSDASLYADAAFGITLSDDVRLLGLAMIRDGNGADAISKLSRYESSIERSFFRALHELERLRAVRRGDPVAVPMAVDISVGDS